MSTSGSYNYNVTGSDILTEALELAGVIGAGETISSDDSTSCLRTLNMMLKGWQPKLGLWLYKELSLFLQDDTIEYSIGPSGTHCATGAVKTELAAAAAAAATTVTIDATTGMGDTFDRNGVCAAQTPAGAVALTLNGALVTSSVAYLSSQRKILIYSDADDSGITFAVVGTNGIGEAVTETITGPATTTVYSSSTFKTITSITASGAGTGNIEVGQVGDQIGIELDGGTVQWTYFAAALSTTVSLVTALTGAAAIDNHFYSYTTQTQRPIEISEARLVKASGYETPLRIAGRNEYMMLSDKTTEGAPNLIYYDKQLNNGVIKVWPEPSDVQEYIKFTAKIPIQDIDSTSNDFEVGQDLFECIAWSLAWRVMPKFGRPIDPMFRATADEMLDNAMVADAENTSVFIQIARR